MNNNGLRTFSNSRFERQVISMDEDMKRRCTETTRRYKDHSVTTSTISLEVKVTNLTTGIIRTGCFGDDGLIYMNQEDAPTPLPDFLKNRFDEARRSLVFAAFLEPA